MDFTFRDEIGDSLYLRKHQTVEGQHTALCGDFEAHRGKDKKIYIIDTARIFPPEPPESKKLKGCFLYRLLVKSFCTQNCFFVYRCLFLSLQTVSYLRFDVRD